MITYTYPDHDTMVLTLLGHYEAADPSTEVTGGTWYVDARREARRLARSFELKPTQVAGIIAALSPQCQWERNLVIAAAVCADHDGVVGQTRGNLEKAWRIRAGAQPLTVLGGPKVRAFYRAIMGDGDSAVLDTWMLTALGWPVAWTTDRSYERGADALRDAARLANLSTTTFQATVWSHVRGGAE